MVIILLTQDAIFSDDDGSCYPYFLKCMILKCVSNKSILILLTCVIADLLSRPFPFDTASVPTLTASVYSYGMFFSQM